MSFVIFVHQMYLPVFRRLISSPFSRFQNNYHLSFLFTWCVFLGKSVVVSLILKIYESTPSAKKRKRKRKVKIKKSFISNNEYPEWRTDYFLKIWRHSEFHETNRNRVKRTQVKLQRMRNMAKNR